MTTKRQAGFSLLELLVAMMILAIIGTVGFVQLKKHSATARHIKAKSNMDIVGDGLDQYYMKHGTYPDFSGYEAMVDPGSVLAKESFIRVNEPSRDPWGQAYEARSSKTTYYLKCMGDPSNPDDPALGWFAREPN
jgi:general secretion pathway protein G